MADRIARARMDREKNIRRAKTGVMYLFYIYRAVTIFCIAIVILFPILYMISVSFRPAAQLNDPTIVWVPRSFTLDNIRVAFQQINYPTALWNTFRIAAVGSLLTVLSCACTGYGFARFKFKFRRLLFGVVLLMMIVPPQNILIAQFLDFSDFDLFGLGQLARPFTGEPFTIKLIGREMAMYLPALLGTGIRAGLYILIFNKFFSNLPTELEDAAAIDGCGHYRTFFRVMIPNALPSFLTVFLFSFVWYWNDYFYISVYMQNSTVLSIQLHRLRELLRNALFQHGSGVTVDNTQITVALQAGCLLAMVPLLILYIVLQRYFTEGVERTGIVG